MLDQTLLPHLQAPSQAGCDGQQGHEFGRVGIDGAYDSTTKVNRTVNAVTQISFLPLILVLCIL